MSQSVFIKVLLALCLVGTLVLLNLVIGHADVGVDLTDEGYYFNWISNPWLYKYYVSQFGYVYHPLYKLLQNDIVLLRQANVLISFLLGWCLVFTVMNLCSQRQNPEKPKLEWLLVSSFCLAIPALFILMITGHWVPSPSYNSLTFNGILIVAIGVVLASKHAQISKNTPYFLIGLGGWLVFMAKPTSAGLLALVVVAILLSANLRIWGKLLISAFAAAMLLLLSAYLIDGSVVKFYVRFKTGLELVSIMSNSHGAGHLFRLNLFTVNNYFLLKIGFLSIAIFAFLKATNQSGRTYTIALILIGVISLSVLANLLNVKTNFFDSTKYHALSFLAILFASAFYFLFSPKQNLPQLNNKKSSINRLIVFFLVLPYVYAFGTGNNYWQTGAGAAIFWLLASLLILSKQQLTQSKILVVQVFTLLVVSTVLIDAMNSPYRQNASIFTQSTPFINPHTGKAIKLEHDTAIYLNNLREKALFAGFKPTTPVIDLTGQNPGALYFLQTDAIGQAWMIGGYPSSRPLASRALMQASCDEIAHAWLLIEKNGKRKISDKVLLDHGITVSKTHYKIVAKIPTRKISWWNGINSNNPQGVYIDYLAKPINVEQHIAQCKTIRSKLALLSQSR